MYEPMELQTLMRGYLEKWRKAKSRLAAVEQELGDIELPVRMGVVQSVWDDREAGRLAPLQPGDQLINDWATLELQKDERWLKLRQERTQLQMQIDENWSEYAILKCYVLSSASTSKPDKSEMSHMTH